MDVGEEPGRHEPEVGLSAGRGTAGDDRGGPPTTLGRADIRRHQRLGVLDREPDVVQAPLVGPAGRVADHDGEDVAGEMVDLGPGQGAQERVPAVAAAQLEHDGRDPAEDRRQVERPGRRQPLDRRPRPALLGQDLAGDRHAEFFLDHRDSLPGYARARRHLRSRGRLTARSRDPSSRMLGSCNAARPTDYASIVRTPSSEPTTSRSLTDESIIAVLAAGVGSASRSPSALAFRPSPTTRPISRPVASAGTLGARRRSSSSQASGHRAPATTVLDPDRRTAGLAATSSRMARNVPRLVVECLAAPGSARYDVDPGRSDRGRPRASS